MSQGRPRTFRGIGASPGIAIGKVFLLDRRSVRVPHHHIEAGEVEREITRLEQAISKSVEQLAAIRTSMSNGLGDHGAILEAHELMLRDRSLFTEASEHVREELINAEWAVERVIARIRGLFDKVADPYFRERRGDVDFAGERILRNLVGQLADISDLPPLGEDLILVAHDLSPVDTAIVSQHKVSAFVTEVGGKTSHTSIIARALELPAVVGVHGIVDAAGSGDVIVVDGLEGSVMLRPSRAQLDRSIKRNEIYQRMSLEILEAQALPARTLDGEDIAVAGNIELPSDVAQVINRGGEAIGLYRTEFMFLGRKTPPSEEDHFQTYCHVLGEVGEREVTIRTFDLGGDKVFAAAGHNDLEPNPALGMRAIRYCLAHPEVFEPQVAGLMRAAARGNVRVMLPMVSCVDEIDAAREVFERVHDRLQREGKEHRADLPIGIMIEVPSSVMLADHLARRADFFAVGTNDLVQYLLAADRTNERVDYLYHPMNPAVLRCLHRIAQAAHDAQIPVSVCGEMAGDLEHTAILLGVGCKQLSMNASSIPRVKRLILELSKSECEDLVREGLRCAKQGEVLTLVREFMTSKTLFPSSLLESRRAEH